MTMETSSAKTANAIKKELKIMFPKIKFSIRSDNYSGGNSVKISWIDGPTDENVDKIVRKYQYGSFDSMEDLYNYDNKRDDISQAKYVLCNRKMSKETEENIIKKHNATFCVEGQIKDLNSWNDDAQCWNNQLVYRKFKEMELI